MFGNPIAQTACIADAVAANVHLPLNPLFWCVGSQGDFYPLDGWVQNHMGGVAASTLEAERMTYKLHREGLLWDSVGVSGPALCHTYPMLIMPKNRYRYQMVNPIPAAMEPEGCKPFGHTTILWGAGHAFPVTGQDFGYLIWRKRNCCAF